MNSFLRRETSLLNTHAHNSLASFSEDQLEKGIKTLLEVGGNDVTALRTALKNRFPNKNSTTDCVAVSGAVEQADHRPGPGEDGAAAQGARLPAGDHRRTEEIWRPPTRLGGPCHWTYCTGA